MLSWKYSVSYAGPVLALSLLASQGPAAACGGPLDVVCNTKKTVEKGLNDVKNTGNKAIDDVANTGKKAIDDSVKTGQKAYQDTVSTGRKAVDDTVNTGKKAIDDIVNSAKKAVDDVIWNAVKGADDIVDAGKAAGRFIENEISGAKDSLTDAEKRIREGKIVDAAWHLGTDRAKNTEEGAAKAAQESELLNAAGQAAASFYGGPAGAAAYAAWYTYRATNDLEMALRVGVITGVTSAGYANTGAMPSGTIGEVAKKSLVTGAVGGLAVAAAGGDDVAVREAFLKSGGMVVVQSGQSYITKEYVDPAVAKADTYCMSAIGTKCSIVLPKLERDANGNIVFDKDGRPKVDTSIKIPERSQVGSWLQQAEAAKQEALRNTPGIDQIYTANNEWAISWNKKAFADQSSSIPAVVLTYTGPGSPFDQKLQEVRAWAAAPELKSPDSQPLDNTDTNRILAVQPTWVALHGINTFSPFFDRVFPAGTNNAVTAGAVLKAKRDINIRPAPADWDGKSTILRDGTLVTVTNVTTIKDEKGRTQEWAQIEMVPVDAPADIDKAVSAAPPVLSGGPPRTRDEPSLDVSPRGLVLPIWCIDMDRRDVFEVMKNNLVRGLTMDLSGSAQRNRNGSLRIRATRAIELGPIDLPWQESIIARVGVDGDLLVTSPSGATSQGSCKSIN